ncbi:cyclase/dehydrase domain protein [Mycobacterium kansasii]|uniref:Cyclase/dehydrase domain protein n=1 Tax=Mycobacterium kansasii TaxID=1768 RepID=A0A1V3WUY3_MYCKA|nr:cyclase/dehydrase domain protein [Mycobacterium kansasii]
MSTMPVTLTVTFTWCGRPSGWVSTTSTRLCTEDHDGTASMSASASMITSGGASMTISLDAWTATATKLATTAGLRRGGNGTMSDHPGCCGC